MRKAAMILMIIPLFFLGNLPVGAAEKEERQWRDESIYYIMVDRFMNGEVGNNEGVDLEDPESYHGGDLQGVIDQLDYIKEMGFTTINLSPIMANEEGGFHGFWIEDFRAVEEHFGTMEEAETLVDEAHERNIKVLFDIPVNHVGKSHPWLENEAKADWFLDHSTGAGLAWLQGMPQLNTTNEEVQQFFQETMDYWIEETGVDGFRFVSSEQVSDQFIQHVARDEVMVYIENLSEEKSLERKARQVFQEAGTPLDELNTEVSPEEIHQLDGYDIERFTHIAVENGQNPITRWELALTYLFTAPGIPQLYYGSEIPLDDGGDLRHLPMMNFKAGDEALKNRVEKLISMRNQFPALTRGDYEALYNQEGLAVFQRRYENQTMIIAINNAEEMKAMELENLKEGQQLRGLLQDGIVRQQSDGSYRLGMERETADVFVVEPDRGYNWLFIGFVGGVLGLFILAVIVISVKNRKLEDNYS